MSSSLIACDLPTEKFKTEVIQKIIIEAQKEIKTNYSNDDSAITWNNVSLKLWNHLTIGFPKNEDQLLCSTCFYTSLTLSNNQECFLRKILTIIQTELELKQQGNYKQDQLTFSVSLIYGLFQSPYLLKNSNENVKLVLLKSFELLIIMAYEYSQFTFVVFKTINSFNKLLNTEMEATIFNNDNIPILLNLVNHNWENPITGVRDLNKTIFKLLLSHKFVEAKPILLEINNMYWNKAKYLMLTEIVNHHFCDSMYNNLYHGLIDSLHKPGLVSAGADMYYSVINVIKLDKDWASLFMEDIMKILCHGPDKATENYFNYWCNCTFKKFPSIYNHMMNELYNMNIEENQRVLHSFLCSIKHGLRSGLDYKNLEIPIEYQNIKRILLIGIDHSNPEIRSLSFDLICLSVLTENEKYDIIINFICHNMNSDCSVLRQHLLSSLQLFITQAQIDLFLAKPPDHVKQKILVKFCHDIQAIIVYNLKLKGNYQRKITATKLANVILTGISEIPRRKRNQITNVDTIRKALRNNEDWINIEKELLNQVMSLLKDPSDDIREHAVGFLLNEFNSELTKSLVIDDLIDDAMICLKSKFFYEISCGQTIFKLIVNLMLKGNNMSIKYKNVEKLFTDISNELLYEFQLRRNILDSIEEGKQLHAFMSILIIILEVCVHNSYELKIDAHIFLNLSNALGGIVNCFFFDQETSTSSDFAKMSTMVEDIIELAKHSAEKDSNELQISGLHQIILNCLWLNVKACNDLCTMMIQVFGANDCSDICEKALQVIIMTLETSRHKGAIESAGNALGKSIQHLTSLPEECPNSKLPYILLTRKLNELICEASKFTSITRRGAGLSIMVHKIVASDMKKGKPLFHYFMKRLLETYTKTEDIPTSCESQDIDNVKDLPKAICIHFLTRIVTDSKLASDVMYYSASLAELAFSNLTSSHWQIRNAALQLYGALVPKLIGQKKISGTDEAVTATVACDEFRTHSPKLWQYMVKQLKSCSSNNNINEHSNLIPILNILANMAKKYSFTFDKLNLIDESLLCSLLLLLDSPIYVVRRLTAKTISNMFDIEVISKAIFNMAITTENCLHGVLTLLEYVFIMNKMSSEFNVVYTSQKLRFSNIMNTKSHSYLSKHQYEIVFGDTDVICNLNKNLVEIILEKNTLAPGYFAYADYKIREIIQKLSLFDIADVLEEILQSDNVDKYLEMIYNNIEFNLSNNNYHDQLQELNKITTKLFTYKSRYECYMFWKLINLLSEHICFKDKTITVNCYDYLVKNGLNYKIQYMVPFLVRVSNYLDISMKIELLNIVSKLCSPEDTDVDLRYIAALSINEFGHQFQTLMDSMKITIFKSEIILLQDEDEDIRNASTKFYNNLTLSKIPINSYSCLCKMLSQEFFTKYFDDPNNAITKVHNEFEVILNSYKSDIDGYNPFANVSKNIYMEENVIRTLLNKLQNPSK